MSSGLRLFVAAEPPEAVCDQLAHWARGAVGRDGGVRRLASGSLHLTLCFLGEQPPSAIEQIATTLEAMAELLAAVEECGVGAPAWLPPRRPRALAVEILEQTGALRTLQATLAGELEAGLGWDPPRQRFRPHITVARMRVGAARARELPPTPPLTFTPSAVTLFRSSLDPDGASYVPLASIPAR